MLPIEIYTDGACSGNPGRGGWAAIVRYTPPQKNDEMPEVKEFDIKASYFMSTNNRMELMAIIEGIKYSINKIDSKEFDSNSIIIFSDSQFCVNAIRMRWIDNWVKTNWITKSGTPVKNKDLWLQVIDILEDARSKNIMIQYKWVKGHDENEFNNRADKLAVEASNDSANYKVDEEYEKTRKGNNH